MEFSDGLTLFFEGEQDAERKVCTEEPDGHKSFYEGERGAERRVRSEEPDGTVTFYDGELGAERPGAPQWQCAWSTPTARVETF